MQKKAFLFALLITLLTSLILVTPAYAITFKTSEGKLTIAEDKTIRDDLYASGESVNIKGDVDGDVLTGAGIVTIDGTISGDFTAAAGTIFLNGEVKDDVRIGGGIIYVNGKVGGDIIIGGGQIILSEESDIGEDALIGSGTLQVNGSIGNNLWVGAGSVNLDGEVGNRGKISADTIDIGSNAEINGSFTYTSSDKADIDPEARIKGKITHKLPPEEKIREARPLAGLASLFFYLLFAFISFLAALVSAFIFIALLPKAVSETTRALTQRVWASLGIGFLVLIIIPVAAIILMITLIGLPAGMITFALYFIFIYLSQIAFSIFLGEKIITSITKKEKTSPYLSALIGLVILAILGFIPFLGWLVKFIAMLFGLGALVLATFGMIKKGRAPVADVSAAVEAE